MTCLVYAEIVLNNVSDVYIENNFLDLKRQRMMRHFFRYGVDSPQEIFMWR